MKVRRLIRRHNKLSYRVILPLTLLIVISISLFILNISSTIMESELAVYEGMVDSFDDVINMQVDHYIEIFNYTFSDYKSTTELDIDKYNKNIMINSILEKNKSFIEKIIVVEDLDNFSNYKTYNILSESHELEKNYKFNLEEMHRYYDLHFNREKFAYYDKENSKFYIVNKINDSLVIIESDLNSLYESFKSAMYSDYAKIGLLTTDGSIMTHSDEKLIGKNVYELGFEEETLNEVFKLVTRKNKFKGEFKRNVPSEIKSKYNEFRYNFLAINDDDYALNWVIMFEIPTDVFQDKVKSIAFAILVGGFLTIFVLIVASRLIINGALKPIDEIVVAMNKASSGDLSVRTDIKSSNEIEIISIRLNEMLEHMEVDHNDLVNQKNEILSLLNEVEELVQENNRVYYETIKTLAKTIDAKDSYTGGHCERVTEVSTKIGLKLKLPSEDIRILSYSGMLHDIGKIGIAESIISKDGKLTEIEFEEIKKHPQIGYDILKNVNFLKSSSQVVLKHHEKLDGSGYPNQLKNEEIDLLSRIIAVADAFDAMSSDRSYRKALSKELCIFELRKNSGSQFDKKIVETLIKLLEDGEIIAFDE